MPKLSSQAQSTIQSSLDSCTSSSSGTGIAGLVFCAIDKNGNYLAQNASGQRGVSTSDPMTMDTTFYIASCTKMITGIACMQLTEEGKLNLDSAEQLYKVCPELEKKKVLDTSGKLVERKGDITTRMLLTHTAGFGYTFFNERLLKYSRPTGFDEFAGDAKDYLEMPLVNQPGSRWEYGINIDWAGILVERISGMTLDAYFKKHIFEPLGINNISFLPTQHMREHLASFNQRDGSTGKVLETDHLLRRAIWLSDTEPEKLFHAGGAGCFAKPSEYCLILAALLNDGVSPTTNKRILSAKSVNEMFTNQIPQFPDFARQHIPAAKPNLTNAIPELYPQPGNPAQGWGLTFMMTIEEGPTGRGKNTGWWAGIANLFWWCDREKGVAGMIAGQVLPFGDMSVMGAWGACEAAVYGGLEQ